MYFHLKNKLQLFNFQTIKIADWKCPERQFCRENFENITEKIQDSDASVSNIAWL